MQEWPRRSTIPFLLAAWLAGGTCEAADLVISEIMAINDSTIRDEDGDTPDFIEIFNAGDAPCDIGGHFLSDDLGNLTKWRFPSVVVAPRGFLLVFASDKDRRDPARPLHANFRLTSEGEDLVLVGPDGTTKLQEFAPYPRQAPGFSYGLAMNATRVRLVDTGAATRALVPSSGALGLSWTDPDFDDGGWMSGQTGVGYDRNTEYRALIGLDVRGAMDGQHPTCYIRVPFTVDGDGSSFGTFILRMKYDDGFNAYLNGQRIASANAPPFLSWDSEATGLHDDSNAVVFEDFQASGLSGVLRSGTNVLAIHGLNDNLGSSDFLVAPELDGFNAGELDRGTLQFFPDPSPGSGNLPGVAGIADPPRIIPLSGVITGPTAVTLEADSPTAEIHYTTDGSIPTQESARYTGPFQVSSSAWVRARVFEPGDMVSQVTSANYIFLAANVSGFRSTIPVVLIENYGGGRPGSSGFQGAFMAIYEPAGGRTTFLEPPALANRAGMKIRGSSTAGRDKVSYTVEFWDEKDDDKNVALLGMPRESDWVLYGAYNFDRAHLRNPLIYELSRQAGRWAARTRFCEVYFNMDGGALDSGDYRGIYSFMEKITRGRDRVDIQELLPLHDGEPEISGGYMLKIDRADPGDSGFGAAGQTIRYVDPKEREIPSYQADWIRDYFNAFYAALQGSNFRHPTLGYAPFVDEESWVDHHLLNVLPKNVDALRLSTYFYKDRGKPIEFGPIWDFDRSMNSTDGRDDDPRTWNGTGDGTRYFDYPWWNRLFQDPDFMQLYRDRWSLHRDGALSTQNIFAVVDRMATEIQEAVPRDVARWGQITVSGWSSEISNLKNWLRTRAEWMDDQLRHPPAFSPRGGQITPGVMVTMSAITGTIYFTLDGTDPRSSGGQTAPAARVYDGPVELHETARVTARARVSASDWSPPTAVTYYTELPGIVISEIMYHPEPEPGSGFDDEAFEFLEIKNIGVDPVPLAGVAVSGGVRFTFPDTGDPVLGPGEYVVLVNDIQAFASRYDISGMFVGGVYEGRLENDGERLLLAGPLGEPILDFIYDDAWYPETDGGGASLVVVDLLAPLSSWNDLKSWAASTVLGGSPGGDDEGFPSLGGRQLPGDANQDGLLDISDPVSLVRRLFLEGSGALPCDGSSLEEGGNLRIFDANGDGGADVSDAIFLLAYMYQGGPEPPAGTGCVRLEGCGNACSGL